MLAAGAALSLVALQSSLSATSTASRPPLRGIRRIRHVIVIMEENRSFDNYFGTYPGADGIPMRNGRPAACLPDARTGRCVRPYLDNRLVDAGGPHDAPHARRDINGGRMNGFVRSAVRASRIGCGRNTLDPACRVRARRPDVMGYHDASTIPEYWRLARDYVLQDHLFASNLGWSLPMHEAMVSGWAARCTSPTDPMSCHTSLSGKTAPPARPHGPIYPWTDITYLLRKHRVSWGYYVSDGVPAGLRKRRHGLRAGAAELDQPEHLEPAGPFRRRRRRRPVAQRPGLQPILPAGPDGHAPQRLLGDPRLRR
jgi:phospholipase C